MKNASKIVVFEHFRSVGVIAYVLLSGLSPFLGDCDADTWANVTQADPLTFDDEPVRPFVRLFKGFFVRLFKGFFVRLFCSLP
jgi:hypothetical protein